MEGLSRLFGKTKQSYYKYDEERIMIRMSQEAFALDYIREIRKKDRGIGGMKIWRMYKRKFAGNSPLRYSGDAGSPFPVILGHF